MGQGVRNDANKFIFMCPSTHVGFKSPRDLGRPGQLVTLPIKNIQLFSDFKDRDTTEKGNQKSKGPFSVSAPQCWKGSFC